MTGLAGSLVAGPDALIQPELDLRRDGVATFRWHMPFGDILIEVFDEGAVCVNGDPVVSARKPGGAERPASEPDTER